MIPSRQSRNDEQIGQRQGISDEVLLARNLLLNGPDGQLAALLVLGQNLGAGRGLADDGLDPRHDGREKLVVCERRPAEHGGLFSEVGATECRGWVLLGHYRLSH